MKLYAYRRAGRIEFETCQLPPETHVTDIGTIEVTESGKEKVPPVTATMEIIGMDILQRRIESLAEVAGRLERVLPKGEQSKKTVTKTMSLIPDDEKHGVKHYSVTLGCDAENVRCIFDVKQ